MLNAGYLESLDLSLGATPYARCNVIIAERLRLFLPLVYWCLGTDTSE